MSESADLVFGWRTALLVVAVLHLLVAAIVLWRRRVERSAHRWLSLFLLVVVGILTPQMIGFAGFYDRWPWLSFAPFDNALAVGPLLMAYALSLTTGQVPRYVLWLLAPAVLNALYALFWFLQPLPERWAWADAVQNPYVQPLVNALAVTLAVYGVFVSMRCLRSYRSWLERTTSASADFDTSWLGRSLAVFGLVVLLWVLLELFRAWWTPLGYVQEYPAYLILAASAYAIAQLALIYGREPFPKPRPAELPVREAQLPAHTAAALSTRARALRDSVRADGLHREPRLTLAQLAAHRATNAGDLSRLINQGLGVNFNRFVNELRIEDACARLRSSDEEILDIALASGFGAKATFNRVFREMRGCSPSEWRRRQRGPLPGRIGS